MCIGGVLLNVACVFDSLQKANANKKKLLGISMSELLLTFY